MTTHLSVDLSNRFVNLQKILKPDVYVEVGAFDAEFSKIILSKNTKAEIWAFEASPYVYAANYPISGINYINKAVSDKNGYVDFEIQKDVELEAVNNSILKRNELKDYDYITVESITLDSLFSKFKNICLWIDCEGANREVLMGAKNILNNVSSIFIEVESLEYWQGQWLDKDVISYLEKYGFYLFDSDSQYDGQYNCIFLKNE